MFCTQSKGPAPGKRLISCLLVIHGCQVPMSTVVNYDNNPLTPQDFTLSIKYQGPVVRKPISLIQD